MKMLLVVTALVCFATQAYAEDWREICAPYEDLAKSVMEKRQEGTSMAQLMQMKATKGNESIEQIIISAYDRPRFGTEEMKKKSIEDFSNQIYLECVKGNRKK